MLLAYSFIREVSENRPFHKIKALINKVVRIIAAL